MALFNIGTDRTTEKLYTGVRHQVDSVRSSLILQGFRFFLTLKQYFPGSQKSADSPLQIFKAFYLAQSKGLCGNYRHFPAKRF